ncbi:hypothetical protein GIB67_004588, partial [Kingdonia uniflora]
FAASKCQVLFRVRAYRPLHIVNELNASATYHMLEFFQYREKFYNQPTHNMSRASVIDHIMMLAEKAVGKSLLSTVESGFRDTQTDLATRVSFKVIIITLLGSDDMRYISNCLLDV